MVESLLSTCTAVVYGQSFHQRRDCARIAFHIPHPYPPLAMPLAPRVVITPYLPSRAYTDLLQVHIIEIIPLSYQDQEINTLNLGRMQMIQGMTLEEGNQGLTVCP